MTQPKKRVYELARELNMTNKSLLEKISSLDLGLNSHMSTLDDEIEARIGKQRTDRHIVTVSNTQTGVVGVRLNDILNRYEVSWVKPDGKQGKTSVSIRKHGRKAAFAKACDIRKQKEAERLSS